MEFSHLGDPVCVVVGDEPSDALASVTELRPRTCSQGHDLFERLCTVGRGTGPDGRIRPFWICPDCGESTWR